MKVLVCTDIHQTYIDPAAKDKIESIEKLISKESYDLIIATVSSKISNTYKAILNIKSFYDIMVFNPETSSSNSIRPFVTEGSTIDLCGYDDTFGLSLTFLELLNAGYEVNIRNNLLLYS